MRSFFSGLRGKLIVASGLPLLIAIAFASVVLVMQYGRWTEGKRLEGIAALTRATTGLIHEIQLERGLSASYIASGGTTFAVELSAQRQRADSARDEYRAAMATTRIPALAPTAVSIESAIDSVARTRASVDAREVSAEQVRTRYSASVARVMDGLLDYAADVTDGEARTGLRQIDAVGQLKEWSARERGTLAAALTAGSFQNGSMCKTWMTTLTGQQIAIEQMRRETTGDISGSMGELNALAQSVAAGAEEGASGAEELRAQSAKLGDAAEGFRTRVWERRDAHAPAQLGGAVKRPPAKRPAAEPAPSADLEPVGA